MLQQLGRQLLGLLRDHHQSQLSQVKVLLERQSVCVCVQCVWRRSKVREARAEAAQAAAEAAAAAGVTPAVPAAVVTTEGTLHLTLSVFPFLFSEPLPFAVIACCLERQAGHHNWQTCIARHKGLNLIPKEQYSITKM